MDKLVGWKLWYCDENGNVSTFSSKQGSWRDAPQKHVQYVVQWWTNGKKKWKVGPHGGCDVYVRDNEQAEKIAAAFPDAKLGSEIDTDQLIKIMNMARKDAEEF